MASDIYLYLTVDGQTYKGAAKQAGYEDSIELKSFGWSMEVKDSPLKTKTQTSTRVKLGQLTLSRFYDSATPRLVTLLKSRKRFTTAEIYVEDQLQDRVETQERGSDNQVMYLCFYNGRIEKIAHSLSDSNKAVNMTETVTLSYDRVVLNYFPLVRDPYTRMATESTTTFDSGVATPTENSK